VAEQFFRHPIGRLEHGLRRFYCETMPRLGFPQFIVRAQGAWFRIGNVDLIDRHIGWDAMWEPMQLERLAALGRRRRFDLFLDLGANTGFYSVMMTMKKLVPEALAFEPDPGNYARLVANLALNGLGNRVRAFPYALGDRKGAARLTQAAPENRGESWLDHADQPAGAVTLTVEERRFDDEFAIKGKNLLIKMDVEGYEFRVLAGMARTLRENSCYLQIELYSKHIEKLKTVCAGLGYRYLGSHEIDHFFTNIAGLE
jgi:FkbM family methyltransferase